MAARGATTSSLEGTVASPPTAWNRARRDVAVAVAGYEYDSSWDPISDGVSADSITEANWNRLLHNNNNVPAAPRGMKRTRSRFTSSPSFGSVENNPLAPLTDEAIYASLHALKDRVAQLESEKSEHEKRSEEFVSEISELRSQLSVIHHRPDSALGSEPDFDGLEKLQSDNAALEASVITLQDRLNRSERHVSVAERSAQRLSSSVDSLSAQMITTNSTVEELKAENSELRDNNMFLQAEFEELKDQISELRKENTELRQHVAQNQARHTTDPERQQKRQEVLERLNKMVQHEKQKENIPQRHVITDKVNSTRTLKSRKEGASDLPPRRVAHRPESASMQNKATVPSLTVQAATDSQDSDADSITQLHYPEKAASLFAAQDPTETMDSEDLSTTQLHYPEKAANLFKDVAAPATLFKEAAVPTTRVRSASLADADGTDLTTLSFQNPKDINRVRVNLEGGLRVPKTRSAPAPAPQPEQDTNYQAFQQDLSAGKLRETSRPQLPAKLLKPTYRKTSAATASTSDDGTGRFSMVSDRSNTTNHSMISDRSNASNHSVASNRSAVSDRSVASHRSVATDKSIDSNASKTSERSNPSRFTDRRAANTPSNPSQDSNASKRVGRSLPRSSPETLKALRQAAQSAQSDASINSTTSHRRRRAQTTEGMTSAFIVPDITLDTTGISQACSLSSIAHDRDTCTVCAPGESVTVTAPVPVTDRHMDATDIDTTLRPSQPPPVALATVIKQLEDEIAHLKIKLTGHQRLYGRHDASLSKSRRQDVKLMMDKYTAEIEKRSDQVYALYDVLEGQKQAAKWAKKIGRQYKVPEAMSHDDIETTLSSIGMETGEISGLIARASAAPPASLDGTESIDGPSGTDTEELHTEDMH